ncbi:cadherin-related family member 2 [Cricetulus griseus]|uniref:Cadherin-related family member 2 n=1 Tax=Cricetulus griseus TaxID=10029 RepID=A0A9J7GW29_CRIGR|nr:cadherin-related family member 2 [Cricetulus griseus]XP_035301304.1 cadherin-related family member 2 [Cricetulus griseus]
MAWLWLLCALLPAFMPSVTANTPPVFNMSSLVTLPEDLPVGAVAFWLVATDSDNDMLTYGITGTYAYFFSVTRDTGEVKLASPLDSETLYSFGITIFVDDNHNSPVRKDLRVIVQDKNDNAPVFQNSAYATSINETLPVGSVVFSVLALDKDTGPAGLVRYYIEKVIPSNDDSKNLFYILQNGSIVLNESLSYNNKSAFYQLQLKACDSGGEWNNSQVTLCSQPVFLSISVVDEPDLDPQFVREFYSASVAEDAALGTSVLKVEAVDADKGVNDNVTYSITNSTRPGWFSIEKDGVITVSGALDREQLLNDNGEVHIQVAATEGHRNIYGQEAKATIWVTIRVTDVNDHKPEFYNCSLPNCSFSPQEAQDNFTGYVDEHTSARIPIDFLTMVAYDPDQGDNGTFLLSLDGEDADAFNVSPERAAGSVSVQVVVRNSEMVDYEKKPVMYVKVVATDSVSNDYSVATVTIHLRDINDHRPTFSQSLYELTVPENSPTGFVVTSSINATDQDKDKWGRITYSLLPGNGEDLFEVDPNSGTVTVKNGTLLDREKQAVYYLTLQATDGGNQSSTTALEITLLDVNDNAPVVRGSYNIFVPEEGGNVSVTIQAYDDDQPDTNNSRLLFSLLPGPYSHNFSIDPNTGLLRNLEPLDREAIDPALEGHIVLTVLVADCGNPPLSTEVNVSITVEDINDNLPIFNQSSYEFFVKERDPGEFVGTVKAWDADQTETNNRISFSLSGTGVNNFVVRGYVLEDGGAEGYLWLLPDVSLDYEAQKFFNLTVSAENPGPQGLESTASVTVVVVDVNDEPPTLDAASLRAVLVAENGSQHGQVAQVTAQDVDTDSLLRIELVDVICTKDNVDVGSVCHEWFSMDANGLVYINQSEAIDYEACNLVTLVVRAHDLNTDSRFDAYSSNGDLPIVIEDKNDNAPYFLPVNQTFVIIPELVSPGQQVAFVQARDEDSPHNSIIDFSIPKADFVSKDGATNPVQVFRIVRSVDADLYTASIMLVTSLDSTLQGIYQVTVQAQDQPVVGPALETQITLNLFTVDQSYRVRLQFSTNKVEVGANVEEIKAALVQATRTSVYVVTIQNIDSTARAQVQSYLDAYFVFSNGSALTLNELNLMIRRDQDALRQLLQLGLVVVSSQEIQESDQPKLLTSVIIGLVVALLLVLVILITALLCVRKSYHRKLQAMKAGKEARKTPIEATNSTAAIPGTNMYNTDRANPMLDLPTKDLGLECLSSSDLDNVSLNSLDKNAVDLDTDSKKIKKPLPHNSPKQEPEPLSAVLSGRHVGTSGPKQRDLSFTNPGLDTTDL